MWVIIEGSDFAGKSTLVQAIVRRCVDYYTNDQIDVLHCSKPETETLHAVLNEYVYSIAERARKAARAEVALVSDRWHFGEATYAPLKRPHTDTDGFGLLGVAGWRYVELFLLSRGAVTFWLQPKLDVLIKRSGRGDDYIKVDELIDIVKLYEQTVPLSPSTYPMRIDEKWDIDELVELILGAAMAKAVDAAAIADFDQYVGSPKPELLVAVNGNLSPENTDMKYLYEALPERVWPRLGFVNTDSIPRSIAELHTALGAPPVVALGETAAIVVHELLGDNEFTIMHDPAWIEQFMPESKTAYGESFRALADNEEVDAPWRL